jgi:two-component system chemotaxis sensor kinase CheA
MILRNKRIFTFEDDAFNLAIISVPLRREGAIVMYSRWGKEAKTHLLNSLPLDIILLDLMYPDDITGYDIYEQIKEIPELQSVPVIVVTAADPDTEMIRARDKGLSGFISKPIDKHFVDYIAQAIDGKPVWEAD